MSEQKSAVRRGKPKKNIVMFALSLALGALGVFYSKHYIEERIAFYKAQLDGTEVMERVIVLDRDLKRGEIVRAEFMLQRPIPQQYVDEGNVTFDTHAPAVGPAYRFRHRSRHASSVGAPGGRPVAHLLRQGPRWATRVDGACG